MSRRAAAVRGERAAEPPPDPWGLVWGQPWIDSATLAAAIEYDLLHTPDPDFRTRLLVRDAGRALRSFWGQRRFGGWLTASPTGERIRGILREDLGAPGFPSIRRKLVDSITRVQVEQVFEILGRQITDRVEVYIAGSLPTLLQGLTARPTEDIDIVDEIPPQIRRQRAALRQIQTDFGLTLGHVQSHYLPARWEQRRQWLGEFGGLRVFLVDVYDIFVSKLSSKIEKHQQDLGVLATKLDKERAKRRLLEDGQAFLNDPKLRPQIEENWRFIFRELLFAEPAGAPPAETKPRRKGRPRKGH